jgi:hypothetical protein
VLLKDNEKKTFINIKMCVTLTIVLSFDKKKKTKRVQSRFIKKKKTSNSSAVA